MKKKRPPLAPRKEEYQGKTEQQMQDSNSFTVFAIICLLATLVVSITHELILWVSK
jgi:hypothetical protein